jgi:elongation factor 1-alpha
MNPENESGNIEYKLKLIDKDETRISSLATQMRYRCSIEGDGEAIYNLGVEDNGTMSGITEEEYNETIRCISKVADKNNYSTSLLSTTDVSADKKIYEVLIREINENKYIDIKVAVAGNVDAGKSTILGSLITGQNDNGRGLTRSYVFNYIHELKSGRTSSVAHQILGFDHNGKVVNNQGVNKLSWSEIVQKSSKIISFFDLAGHEKYLRTTIMGLTSSAPDICMIMVDANNGIKPMTKEHIFLCATLRIPFIIVITKIDICKDRQNILKETIQGVNKFLKFPGIRRIPVPIKNKEDILLACKNIYSESISPVFQVSSVTGEGMEDLKTFLNIIGKKVIKNNDDLVEFHVDNIFNVYGFGLVIGGQLISGKISVGDKLLIGPCTGNYEQIVVRSIYSKKTPVQKVSSGSYVCLGIKKPDKINIRKGLAVISNKSEKLIVKKFIAEITVLRTHSTTIKVGYEPLFHAYSIRQVVKIADITNKKNSRGDNILNDDNILRNGDTAQIVLEFKYNPQYLKPGTRFILAEGKCKIVGEVLSI